MKSLQHSILSFTVMILTIVPSFGMSYDLKEMRFPGFQDQDTVSKQEAKLAKRAERKAKRPVYAPVSNPNHADYVFSGEKLPKGQTVLEALSGRVPGMMINNNKVVTHGPSSFYGNQEPLMLVDNIEVSFDFGNSIPMEEIERIEVFIGAAEAMYGSRASKGVISIIRKHTQF